MGTWKKTVSAAEKAELAAERAEKTAAAQAALEAGLTALQSDDAWKAMLSQVARSARARFSPRRYSFANQILLLTQGAYGPVATFQAWKGVGRSVKKGEKARYIRQPRPFERSVRNAETGETEARRGMFFRLIPVFTLDQTEGAELPDAKVCGDVAADQVLPFAVETLRTVALGLEGAPVSAIAIRPRGFGDPDGAAGWYVPSTREIVVVETDNAPAMFGTLCHEVAHAILHGKAPHHEYAANEVEAESVAFVVAAVLGLDTAAFSFPYVAGWAGRTDTKEAARLVQASGDRILRAVNVILDALLLAEDAGAEEEAAA